MFTMMNASACRVGMQGLGVGEVAYQSAVAYAKDRLQGRSLAGAKHPSKPADPIIVHPDVRRMLLTMRAYNEGCRALGGWVARQLDRDGALAPTPSEREEAEDFVALMTPIVKALFTDLGFDRPTSRVQVYGGHGYIRDHGMEQLVRDARIAMIYEGTNGIQALDLVGRKLPRAHGAFAARVLPPGRRVHRGEQRTIRRSARWCRRSRRRSAPCSSRPRTSRRRGMSDPEEAGAAATEYLRLFGPGGARLHVGAHRPSSRVEKLAGCGRAMPGSTRPSSRRRGSTSSASCRRSGRCGSRSSPARPR